MRIDRSGSDALLNRLLLLIVGNICGTTSQQAMHMRIQHSLGHKTAFGCQCSGVGLEVPCGSVWDSMERAFLFSPRVGRGRWKQTPYSSFSVAVMSAEKSGHSWNDSKQLVGISNHSPRRSLDQSLPFRDDGTDGWLRIYLAFR